ncbi:MAG: hypothetical protein JEZ06_18345 [Anaerolineaceae bacterium]|nr:hypothetical protein [Anaerolineaceae bacterium]
MKNKFLYLKNKYPGMIYLFILCSIAFFLSAVSSTKWQPDILFQDNSGGEVNVWIEYPFDQMNIPDQEISFVVYASGPGGVNEITLKIDEESLPKQSIQSVSTDNSNLISRLDQTWVPPGEGKYLLEALASSKSGGEGQAIPITFCVGNCDPEIEKESITPSVTPTLEGSKSPTPTKTATLTKTPTIAPKAEASFWASPSTISAGECAILYWDVENGQYIYINDVAVIEKGERTECLCETNSYRLTIENFDHSIDEYWTTIDVSGSCAPDPSTDSSGPSINSVSTFWEGCTIYGQANLGDPSGVIWAEFWFNHNEQGWAWIQMNPYGEDWTSQVGVETDGFAGSIVYKIRTEDTYHNETWSGEYTHNYNYCGE